MSVRDTLCALGDAFCHTSDVLLLNLPQPRPRSGVSYGLLVAGVVVLPAAVAAVPSHRFLELLHSFWSEIVMCRGFLVCVAVPFPLSCHFVRGTGVEGGFTSLAARPCSAARNTVARLSLLLSALQDANLSGPAGLQKLCVKGSCAP